MTLSKGLKPVKWTGRRTYDGRFIRGNIKILLTCP
jgi:hypothetical protein